MRVLAVLLATLMASALWMPAASAAFGPESPGGWPINVLGEEVRPPVDPVELLLAPPPLNKVGPVTLYPYYPLLVAELQRLADDHPDLVRLHNAGGSTLQLPLWYLEISDFHNIEAGTGIPLAEREVVFIDGGTHSNEYSGVYFVTELAQFLLDEYATNDTARWIVEHRSTFLMPMVNPDGSHLFGRLNAKAININRNFPATWSAVTDHAVLNNPGPGPASETETQTVITLLDGLGPDYVGSIHCCGNLWLHPYGAQEHGDPADIEMYNRICDEVFAEVREDCGPIWSTIYPANGTSTDEGYVRFGASSWTYEMSGRGKTLVWGEPALANDVREQEHESWNGILHALLNVHKYGALPVVTAIEGNAQGLRVTIENQGWGRFWGGNLTIDGRAGTIPEIGPENATTVVVAGPFSPGLARLNMEWSKRAGALAGEDIIPFTLIDTGAGYTGHLHVWTERYSGTVSKQEEVPVPSAVLPLVLLGMVSAALFSARRRR